MKYVSSSNPSLFWYKLGLIFICGVSLPACLIAGGGGQLQNPALVSPHSTATADVKIDRQQFVLGTIFDFRAARLLVTKEFLTLDPVVSLNQGAVAAPSAERQIYIERRVFRLDVPVLSVWDFKNKSSLHYPGLMEHRDSLDLWLRGGVTDGGGGSYLGVAFGWYEARFLGILLAVDYWTDPVSVEGLHGSTISSYSGETEGWIIGLELNVATGEYALDAVKWLWKMDKKFRSQRHP